MVNLDQSITRQPLSFLKFIILVGVRITMSDRKKGSRTRPVKKEKRQKEIGRANILLDRVIPISIFIFSSFLFNLVFAQASSASTQLTTTLCQVYKDLNTIIPVVAFVLFVLSGVSYAAGQFFGAETRARAITW